MIVTLTECTINPVLSIERAAANCYDSEPSSGAIMNACYTSGHHSVLEFADFTFHVEGISRACSHQLVRHRTASYAQRSQRYVTENNFSYVIPKSIENNYIAKIEYEKIMHDIKESYEYMQELGIEAEDARMVLPNACETIIEVKMNGRELIHFCNERLCTRAQWEIRELAQEMKKCVSNYNYECKKFAKFLTPKCYKNSKYPFCTEHKSCGLAPKLEDVYTTYLNSKKECISNE